MQQKGLVSHFPRAVMSFYIAVVSKWLKTWCGNR